MAGLILLTGATGYVGGRLLSLLEQRGNRVRCLTRRPDALSGHISDHTEVVAGDLLDRNSLCNSFVDVETAFYFVHSMGNDRDFEEQDRLAAKNFAEAATAAGSSISVVLEILITHFPNTFEAVRRLEMFSAPIIGR